MLCVQATCLDWYDVYKVHLKTFEIRHLNQVASPAVNLLCSGGAGAYASDIPCTTRDKMPTNWAGSHAKWDKRWTAKIHKVMFKVRIPSQKRSWGHTVQNPGKLVSQSLSDSCADVCTFTFDKFQRVYTGTWKQAQNRQKTDDHFTLASTHFHNLSTASKGLHPATQADTLREPHSSLDKTAVKAVFATPYHAGRCNSRTRHNFLADTFQPLVQIPFAKQACTTTRARYKIMAYFGAVQHCAVPDHACPNNVATRYMTSVHCTTVFDTSAASQQNSITLTASMKNVVA